MALCSACKNVNVPNLVSELDVLPDWWENPASQSRPRGMVHLPDARLLPSSAAGGCSLCRIILEAILPYHNSPTPLDRTHPLECHNKRDTAKLQHHLIKSPIYLRPDYAHHKPAFPEEDVVNAWHVRGLKIFVPVDHGVLTGQIRLFALQGEPAAVSCDVTGRPALTSSDSPDAYNLIKSWMGSCLANHGVCKETLSGSVIDESLPSILPTRIIHVGRPNEAICPRLIETCGQTGYYVALSHCWGSLAHGRALMTTQSTLESHIAGIPWHTIPRAFQDAIVATHHLGLEYIWIDSLCIIQDSRSDWLRESALMGTVYENARLTIAASHASNSSEPCFFPRSETLPSIELQHVLRTGECDGSIFASPMPRDYASISPEFGPLAYRAWATQEWLLSRRMIFYTADCLVWSCKTISQRETGGSFHSTARNSRWKIIVEKYSARLLTRSSDRLIALEGLRMEVGKKRINDVYCLGLWKNSMPDQLLWYCVEPAERAKSSLGLPTWTWASTMHGVRFLDISDAKNTCSGFRFDEGSANMIICGIVKKVPRLTPLADKSWVKNTTLGNEVAPLTAPPETSSPSMRHYILADNGAILGWAIIDEEGMADTSICCLRMMSKKISLPKTDGVKRKVYKEWVLLLHASQNGSTVFRRVGVGVITTTTPWFEDQAMSHASIW